MKKEIGSIFPLSNEAISGAEVAHESFKGEKKYYSLCREALFDIARHLHTGENDTVFIPAYTCQTVITPFEEVGWKCVFYSIRRDLRINIPSLIAQTQRHLPSAIVVHPYFGMELNAQEEEALMGLGERGVKIVLDLTQCVFSIKRYPFVSFTVGSYRKWFPIPDGGFLECLNSEESVVQPQNENKDFVEKNVAAMYLRGLYFANGEQRTKDISIRLNKSANRLAKNNIYRHRISDIAYNLLLKENFEENQKCRLNNYSFLYQNICDDYEIQKVCQCLDFVTTAPLYFPIYVQNRLPFQRLLIQDAIYAPVIWPVDDQRVYVDNDVRYIYDHLLAIPCDQRYNTDDMQRIVTIINKL